MCRAPTTMERKEEPCQVDRQKEVKAVDEYDRKKDKADKADEVESDKLRKGTLYAYISLGLLISAFSLVMPHMQSRRDELQCDSLCQGGMTSARSALSLIGSALMGHLSDSSNPNLSSSRSALMQRLSNGRIVCLVIGTCATLAGLLVDASMYSIRGLWLAMIPSALLQQNFSIYKALLADYHQETISPSNSSSINNSNSSAAAAARAGSVGKLGMSVGLAFMVGPLLGATLVSTYQQALSLATCLTLLSLIWVLKMPVPSSLTTATKTSAVPSEHSSSFHKIGSLFNVKAAKTKPVVFLIAIRASMALAFHIFNTIWTVSLKTRFNFGPSDHGKFMSFIGLTFALSQGFIAKLILKPFQHTNSKGRVYVILLSCIILGVGRVVAFQVQDLKLVYVMFAFIVTSLGVVNTILTADTCLIAPSSQFGGVYGVLEASQSAAGMFGPFLGGLLATNFHPIQAPLTAVVALYAFVFFLVLFQYEHLILQQPIQHKNNCHATKTTTNDSTKEKAI